MILFTAVKIRSIVEIIINSLLVSCWEEKMAAEKHCDAVEKKEWLEPQVIEYGSVEKITLNPKGWGTQDGCGLQPDSIHPSL